MGRALYNSNRSGEKGVNTFTVPLQQISKGMYMVKVSSTDDTNTLRFIKQ
jgi:hypothetical protein